MNNSNNKDITSGVAGLVAIILFVTGVVFNQLPIEILRPKGAEMKSIEARSLQHVEARLWQDPFEAAKNHAELESKENKPEKPEKITEYELKTLPSAAKIYIELKSKENIPEKPKEKIEYKLEDLHEKMNEHLTKYNNHTITVLGVMVNAGSYAEYAEQRRRMRYAVLAGLNTQNYVSQDHEHIGYIQKNNKDSSELPEIIPFEWIISFDREKRQHKILVLWIAEDNFRDDPYARLLSLFYSLKCINCNINNYKIKILGPFNPYILKRITDKKYEIESYKQNLNKIESFKQNLTEIELVRFKSKYQDSNIYLESIIDLEFYSATTTVSTKFILGKSAKDNVLEGCEKYKDNDEKNLKCIFNYRLFRTIHPDHKLADILIKELNKRNIELGRDKILLLSEWDTLYGQYLLRIMEHAFCGRLEFKTADNREKIIHDLEMKFKLKSERKESPIWIVHPPKNLEEWTIMGFNDAGEFRSVEIDDSDYELLKELKNKPEDNKCKILDLVISRLNGKNKSYFAETLLRRYTYLRGLDGDIPASKNGEDKQKKQENQTATDQQLSKEQPEGTGQFDYIRRLANKIADEIKDNNLEGKLFGNESKNGRVKAIGILGSDVHDKLILLQALRPKLQDDMIFFTTNMDARLIPHGSHDWGRNLIVASSFGLNLHNDFQKGIPPFRDVYQTSTFLATQLAVGDKGCDIRWMSASDNNPKDKIISGFKIELESEKTRCAVLIVNSSGDSGKWTVAGFNNKGKFCEVSIDPNHENIDIFRKAKHTLLDKWLNEPPRLFEIGRTKEFNITTIESTDEPESKQTCSPVEDRLQHKMSISNISKLNPPVPSLFPYRERYITGVVATIIMLLIILSGSPIHTEKTTNLSFKDSVKALPEKISSNWFFMLIVSLYILGLFYCIFPVISGKVDIHDNYEPFFWFDGISIWPTEIIRLITIILSFYFFYHSWKIIKKDQNNLQIKFFGNVNKKIPIKNSGISIIEKIFNIFRKSKKKSLDEKEAKELFDFYLLNSRFNCRIIRVSILLILFFIFVGLPVVKLFPFADPPARGQFTFIINEIILFASILPFWFLLFFIRDAIRCSERLLHDMASYITKWPEDVINRYRQQWNIKFESNVYKDKDIVNDWLKVEVAAIHTDSILRLVWYPFIILILLIFALNHLFDKWDFPWSLGIVITFAFTILILSAWRLQRAAEKLRSDALDRLYKKMVWAKGYKSLDATADQIRLLIEQINNLKRGAFQSFLQRPLSKSILALLGSWGVIQLVPYFYR